MVQLIAAAAIGGVAYVAYKEFRKHMDALAEKEREEAVKKDGPKQVGDLEHDPETGRYKLRKDAD